MGFRKPPPPAQPSPAAPKGMQSFRDKLKGYGTPEPTEYPYDRLERKFEPITPELPDPKYQKYPLPTPAPSMDIPELDSLMGDTPPAGGAQGMPGGGVTPEAIDQALKAGFAQPPAGAPPAAGALPGGVPPTPAPRRGVDLEGKEPPNRPAPRPRGMPPRPTLSQGRPLP